MTIYNVNQQIAVIQEVRYSVWSQLPFVSRKILQMIWETLLKKDMYKITIKLFVDIVSVCLRIHVGQA